MNARILPRLFEEKPASLNHQLIALTWSVGKLYNLAHQLMTQQAAGIAARMLPLPLSWAAPSPAMLAKGSVIGFEVEASAGSSSMFGSRFDFGTAQRKADTSPFPPEIRAEQDALLSEYKALIRSMEEAPVGVQTLLGSISSELQGALKGLPTRCGSLRSFCYIVVSL